MMQLFVFNPAQTKPNEAAIKAALGGRSRCAIEYFDTFTASNCPDPNSPEGAGTPENPDPSAACITDNDRTHMNEEWASEPYVPPHMMEDPMPDRAIYKFSEYEGHLCEAVCPYVGSYCEFKGITCSSDNRRKLQVPPTFCSVLLRFSRVGCASALLPPLLTPIC
eukprot:6144642-Pleurochrysis_carterae.AAC.4